MPENWSWRTRQCNMQMRQRDVAALDAKIHEELAVLKLKMMLCVMMLPLVVVSLHIKAVCQSVHWSHHPPPAWIMQPPPTGRHRWTGLFHPQREADHYAKTTGRNPSILMSSADRVAHIDGQLMQLLWAIHTRFQRSIKMPKVIKPSNPFTNVCWVSVLTTFSAPPQILAASTVFFCPIPETKKWWVMVSFGATAAGLFWTVNVCWAHPVISRASAVAVAFSWCYSRCFFEVRRIVCVEN